MVELRFELLSVNQSPNHVLGFVGLAPVHRVTRGCGPGNFRFDKANHVDDVAIRVVADVADRPGCDLGIGFGIERNPLRCVTQTVLEDFSVLPERPPVSPDLREPRSIDNEHHQGQAGIGGPDRQRMSAYEIPHFLQSDRDQREEAQTEG